MNGGNLLHLGPQFSTHQERNNATTPDLVLCNDKTFHNILIEQGPLTTSDHFPIICTITAKPIEINTSPCYDMNRANWGELKRITVAGTEEINTEGNLSKESLDNKIEKWHNVVKTAMEKTIPIKRKQTIMKELTSRLIKQVQHHNKILQNRELIKGWERNKFLVLQLLKRILINETKKVKDKNWADALDKVKAEYKNPQKIGLK